MNIETTIRSWQEAKDALAEAQEKERRLRLLLEAAVTDASAMSDGTFKQLLSDGSTLKVSRKLSYKLDKPEQVNHALDRIQEMTGADIVEQLVRWKPELSVSVYKKLRDDVKAVINNVLEIKQSLPTVEVVPVKEQK